MPTYNCFQCSKQSEFFISIAKQGIHSFLMLGVVKNESPKLIARLGKTNDIDPDHSSTIKAAKKIVGDGSLARLADEDILRQKHDKAQISYQAYTINYEQLKEFLRLVAEIERKQLENDAIRDGIIRVYTHEGIENKAIRCYVPVHEETESDEVTFEYKKLSEYHIAELHSKQAFKLAKEAQQIQLNNTCRDTSINLVEAILGFATNVSRHFFVSPDYKTTLKGGQPDRNTFYVLPPPPTVFKEHLTEKQSIILSKLYERMKEIPKSHLDDPKTRVKFEALKTAYKEITGENKLSVRELLNKISDYEEKNKSALFDKRSPNFLSRFFALPSTTETMFKEMKKELQQEINAEQTVGTQI